MGPNIQMPSPDSPIVRIEQSPDGKIVGVYMNTDWAAFLQLLAQTAYSATRAASTSSRPTAETAGRYVGMPFFDQTLGFPVFLKHASSSVWVDGAGVVR